MARSIGAGSVSAVDVGPGCPGGMANEAHEPAVRSAAAVTSAQRAELALVKVPRRSTPPRTATPRAAASELLVVATPPAEPARSLGTSERITLVSWELAIPAPRPKRARAAPSGAQSMLV